MGLVPLPHPPEVERVIGIIRDLGNKLTEAQEQADTNRLRAKKLEQELKDSAAKLVENKPALNALAAIVEDQKSALAALRAENDDLRERLNDAAEQHANGISTGDPLQTAGTPLLRAAEALTVATSGTIQLSGGNEAYKRQYLRARGWVQDSAQTWRSPAGVGGTIFTEAVKQQMKADAQGFEWMLQKLLERPIGASAK